MRLSRGWPVAFPLIVLHMAGCTSWRPSPVSPRQVIEERQPKSVRITTTDGNRSIMRQPAVENDSIRGILSEESSCETSVAAGGRQVCATSTERMRIALSDVTMVEVRAASPQKVALLAWRERTPVTPRRSW